MGEDGIIAMSPQIAGEPHTLPHRIVLRDLGSEFVVHMQVINENGARSYFHGNYIPKRDQEALAKAWAHFERRARYTMNIAVAEEAS
jgi:hypothetical protein